MQQHNGDFTDLHLLGFYRIAAAIPPCIVGDCTHNAAEIITLIRRSAEKGADTVLFPALTITSASCGDLFSQYALLASAEQALQYIVESTANIPITAVIGFPFLHCGNVYSTAAVLGKGQFYGLIPLDGSAEWNGFAQWNGAADTCSLCGKKTIPWGNPLIFEQPGTPYRFMIGINAPGNAAIHLVPLAQPAAVQSFSRLEQRFTVFSQTSRTAVVFANAGWGESSTDNVYAGEAGIVQAGSVLAKRSGYTLKNFLASDSDAAASPDPIIYADIDCELLPRAAGTHNSTDFITRCALYAPPPLPPPLVRPLNKNPFIPLHIQHHEEALTDFFLEILEMQARGLTKRLKHTRSDKIIAGISGGLDSTLALLVAVIAARLAGYPPTNVYAITMPGFGTTQRTKSNAQALAETLGCTFERISITKALLYHFKDIGHSPSIHNTVYENAQARERTQILMDKANQLGALLIGTGDLSESALGWETYNGDHISMYNVNAGIPKTILQQCISMFIRYPALCTHDTTQQKKCSRILQDILETPISPELLPPENRTITQKTESILGPYELHDFFLYHILHTPYSPRKIFFLACQTFCKGENPSYPQEEVLKCIQVFYRRFFSQQFKRSCAPDGVQVGLGSFSPRGAWKMPSDISPVVWLNELENLSQL